MLVPLGGQTMLLSTKRYNPMAERWTHSPQIEVSVRIGVLSSYPQTPVQFDGSPVAGEDLLFVAPPVSRSSPDEWADYWLAAGERETNELCESTPIGIDGVFGEPWLAVDSSLELGVAQGYSVSIGTSALFSGAVRTLVDDPSTPEDEFALHRYSFSPYVYRERYSTPAGEPAGYDVVGHTVGPYDAASRWDEAAACGARVGRPGERQRMGEPQLG